jgi:hypothetical protein
MARNRDFWIIISGVAPTAFRSPNREDLLPTLRQLQRKQPDTTMMWFDGRRFWTSPAAARASAADRRNRRADSPPERRDEWRPGGDHKDPRARYKQTRDQKRARFKKRLIQNSRSSTRKDDATGTPSGSPKKDSGRPPAKSGKPGAKAGTKPRSGSASSARKPTGRKPPATGAARKSGRKTSAGRSGARKTSFARKKPHAMKKPGPRKKK